MSTFTVKDARPFWDAFLGARCSFFHVHDWVGANCPVEAVLGWGAGRRVAGAGAVSWEVGDDGHRLDLRGHA